MAGFLVTGISIARYVQFKKHSESNFTCKHHVVFTVPETNMVPKSDDFVNVDILSLAEIDVSIVCFRPFLY